MGVLVIVAMKMFLYIYGVRTKSHRGFTLVELLIVMVILAILLSLGLGNYFSSQAKSRDSRRKADLQNITRALEVYYNDKGEYPVSTGNTGIGGQNWGAPFVDMENPTQTLYMNVLPKDPSGAVYYYDSEDGSYFQLYARLENEDDLAIIRDETDAVLVYSGTDCGPGDCNYGISSTNTSPEVGHIMTEE